jgi:hypothetical protein
MVELEETSYELCLGDRLVELDELTVDANLTRYCSAAALGTSISD